MRTTVDIPDTLLRRAKAEASLRGMSFKEYLAAALRAALRGDLRPLVVAEPAPAHALPEKQVLGEDCVFPLVRGEGGAALRDLTPARLHEILEQEDDAVAGERPPAG